MIILPLITGDYKRLSQVNRYSAVPVLRYENVAEHLFYVSFYSMMLARDLQARGYEVDVGLAVQKALLHDFEESISGDIIRTFKYNSMELKNIIDETSKKVFKETLERNSPRISKELFKIWLNAKDNTLEGKIVAFADLLSVISYCDEEIRKGNSYMYEIMENALDALNQKFASSKTNPFAEYLLELEVLRKAVDNRSIKEISTYRL